MSTIRLGWDKLKRLLEQTWTGKRIIVPIHNDATTPEIAFGDGDTGFYEYSDDQIIVAIAGTAAWGITKNIRSASNDGGGLFGDWTASATQPTLAPAQHDDDTGIGHAAADQVSIIAGGVEGIRVTEASTITSRLSDKTRFSNTAEGNTGSLNLQVAREVVTLTGATKDTTLAIPTGSMLLGASFTVNTAVSDDDGNDTWGAAYITGSTTELVAAGAAKTVDTKKDTLIVPEIASDATEIQFTPNGTNFDGGVIEVLAYYYDLTSLANAA